MPLVRDLDETVATLTAWLVTVPGFAGARVDNVSIPTSTGFSNETIFFDAHVPDESRAHELHTHELVARIAPRDYQVFLEPDFEQQFAIMQILGDHTDVPAAKVYRLERDDHWLGSAFWIMERVSGRIPTDNPPYASSGWLHDAPPDRQTDAWWSGIDAMAGIHRLDIAPFVSALEAGSVDPLTAQLDYYERFLAWAEDDTPHPLAREVLARLKADRPAPPTEGPALAWGDARFSNLIYRDFDVVAVLDWEMAAIGDPLLDLGWWLFSDHALTTGSGATRLPGFPSAADTAAHWSLATGRSAEALDYYVLFSALRFSVIMLRMGKLLHEMGLVPDNFAYDNLISSAMRAFHDARPGRLP